MIAETAGRAFYFQVQANILPCLAFVPILYLIVYAIVSYQFRKLCRESVMERLREI